MKTLTLLLFLLVTAVTGLFAKPATESLMTLEKQIQQQLHLPARLLDEDSLSFEVSFEIDSLLHCINTQIRGGNALQRALLSRQLQAIKSDHSSDLSGKRYSFTVKIKR
jgi:hypothetical protein